LSYTRQKKNKTYILKPENGCQGKGIWLTKSPKEIKPQEHMLCQQYLSKVSFEAGVFANSVFVRLLKAKKKLQSWK